MNNKPIWQMVIETVKNLGGKATNSEIKKYINNCGNIKDSADNCKCTGQTIWT